MAKKSTAKMPPLPKAHKASTVKLTQTSTPGPDVDAPKTAKKPHTRVAKPSEAELLLRGRKLAASYLVQRDGMDEDTATMVIDSMEAADVNALITEANTNVMDRTPEVVGAVLAETPELPPPAFTDIEALAQWEEAETNLTFPALVLLVAEAGTTKNAAEKMYKLGKKKMIDLMKLGEVQAVECMGIILTRYPGKSPDVLDVIKLVEKGVSMDIINQCYTPGTPWEDVRVTMPKRAK